jgi:hypothetical protein
MQDPFGFLLSFVPGKKLRVCATDVATVPKGGESHRYRVTASRDACDVFVTSGGADLREHGLQRVKPNGFVVWSWSKKSELSHNSKIFGENPHETVYFLERHLLTPVYRYEFRGMVHLLLQKPAKPFVNPTLDAFMEDRKNSEYGETPRAKESYAFVITIPYNFDKEMADEHLTAVFQLRKRDPTRDVCVFLVLNTPPGAIEGRGWGKTSAAEWNRTYLPQIDAVRSRFTTLGAKVYVRPRMPQKPSDDALYYQFDYQKIYVWNLRYEQVAFLDADMMIGSDPGSVFKLCGQHFCCAVQDPGAYGGYFNNGFFVMSPKLEFAEELLHSWWKEDPPWRQICLQDIMNEVFAKRWKALPEAYNFQGLKHGHFDNACNAHFVHYKDCHKRQDNPICANYMKQKGEARTAHPDLFR